MSTNSKCLKSALKSVCFVFSFPCIRFRFIRKEVVLYLCPSACLQNAVMVCSLQSNRNSAFKPNSRQPTASVESNSNFQMHWFLLVVHDGNTAHATYFLSSSSSCMNGLAWNKAKLAVQKTLKFTFLPLRTRLLCAERGFRKGICCKILALSQVGRVLCHQYLTDEGRSPAALSASKVGVSLSGPN